MFKWFWTIFSLGAPAVRTAQELVSYDMIFPVKLRQWTRRFLTWSILFIKIPSYFSHLWNYAIKLSSKETTLLVVQKKKKTFCAAGSTKTYENWKSNAQFTHSNRPGYLAKKYYLKKMTMQPLFVVFKEQRVYDGEYAPPNKKTFESKCLLIPWWCWSTSVTLSSWVELMWLSCYFFTVV